MATAKLNILSLPPLELLAQKRAAPGGQTQFLRDGRRLFYGDDAGAVWTLDTRTWRPVDPPVRGRVRPRALRAEPRRTSPRHELGQRNDATLGARVRRRVGTPLPGVPGAPARAAFGAEGTGLVTIGRDGRGDLWNLRPESWAQRACTVAGRMLSRSEWRDALPERDHAPSCRR